VSLKTQELYLLVFVSRYLDLFTNFYSVYNVVMKIFYLSASGWIVYMLRAADPWRASYKAEMAEHDNFLQFRFAVLPCLLLAFFCNNVTHWWGVVPIPFAASTSFGASFEEYWWAFRCVDGDQTAAALRADALT
jgi:hypothetical protein